MRLASFALCLLILSVAASSAATYKRHKQIGIRISLSGPCPNNSDGTPYDGKAFVNNKHVCHTNWDPATNFGLPTCNSDPVTQDEQDLLAAAFNLTRTSTNAAGSNMRQQLCHLTNVFIIPDYVSSWGFWDPQGNGRYIGIATHVVKKYYDLAQEENDLLVQNLSLDKWNPSVLKPPAYDAVTYVPGLAVLARMAHELGHVLFYDVNAPSFAGRSAPPDYSGLTPNNNPCYAKNNGAFKKTSWDNPPNARYFVPFNQETTAHLDKTPSVSMIRTLINNGQFNPASDAILAIVSTGDWASVFAAVSPEEDFVETYKTMAMSAAQTALNFTLSRPSGPDYPIDFTKYLQSGAAVKDKKKCIESLGIAP
jgi:hypothetical protein